MRLKLQREDEDEESSISYITSKINTLVDTFAPTSKPIKWLDRIRAVQSQERDQLITNYYKGSAADCQLCETKEERSMDQVTGGQLSSLEQGLSTPLDQGLKRKEHPQGAIRNMYPDLSFLINIGSL